MIQTSREAVRQPYQKNGDVRMMGYLGPLGPLGVTGQMKNIQVRFNGDRVQILATDPADWDNPLVISSEDPAVIAFLSDILRAIALSEGKHHANL